MSRSLLILLCVAIVSVILVLSVGLFTINRTLRKRHDLPILSPGQNIFAARESDRSLYDATGAATPINEFLAQLDLNEAQLKAVEARFRQVYMENVASRTSGASRNEQLAEYSTQSLRQSKLSFWISFVFASLGFVVIIAGAGLALTGHSLVAAAIPVISGSVVDAVSVLFISQERRAQSNMRAFFEDLQEQSRLQESLLLQASITDGRVRSRLQAALALELAGMRDFGPLYGDLIRSSLEAEGAVTALREDAPTIADIETLPASASVDLRRRRRGSWRRQ